MIGWFPTAYPDELFYSLCARYAATVQYPNKEHVISELFARRGLSIAVDLPSSLKVFVSNLPPENSLTAERIIFNHTLLPFYAPFLPAERVEKIKQFMCNTTGEAIHKLSGITPSTIRPPSTLRFCPICAETDKQNFGTPYWHRSHQLPGVEICSIHSVFLENSMGQIKNAVYKADLSAAEQNIPDISVRQINLDIETHRLLLQLAKDVEWILNQKNLCLGYKQLENLYMNALREKEALLPHGAINLKRLNQNLRDSFPRDFLQIVQSDYDETKGYNWAARIIPHLKHEKVHHPLRHLLLIRALGKTLESFFDPQPIVLALQKSPVEDSYFLKAPYPCLNAVCQNYRKPTIKNYQICKSKIPPNYTLLITCECGYSYSRKGPDKSPDDFFRKDSIRHYGKLWQQTLRIAWTDITLSLSQIAKLLNTGSDIVKKQAIILGLKFPRQGPKTVSLSAKTQGKLQKNKITEKKAGQLFRAKRDKIRRIWLKAMKKNPTATRSHLKNIVEPKAGLWLTKYDKDWLQANQPECWKRTESARQIDWKSRDAKFVIEIREAAERIRRYPGKPVKICPGTIAREVGHKEWIAHHKYKKKLPLSHSVLKEVAETKLDFELRRIHFAVQGIKSETRSAAFSTVAMRARINWERWTLPEIKTAIEIGISEIENNKQII